MTSSKTTQKVRFVLRELQGSSFLPICTSERPYRRDYRTQRSDRYPPEPELAPSGAKLRIDNLHYDLTEDDLGGLFTRIGPVSSINIRYDRAGRSEGTAFVTYRHVNDARTAIREFDGANAKGQPIRLTLLPSPTAARRGGRNPFDNVEKPKGSLFDRIKRPGNRNNGRTTPESESGSAVGGNQHRGRRVGRYRRSDVSKPPPDHIDRYVPGQNSPTYRNRGGRRPGERRDDRNHMNNHGRRLVNGRANGRVRKTQEELDQEMDDYWGNSNAGAGAAEKNTIPAVSQQAAPAPNPTAGDDDIDMIE
ncbi:hypothetical protein Egran_01998 [Elaphomyces granulatus]|uniref:RRM domain-containing protein n=1 Tax=Elaphomyces granulatus TaxID=519963 RepID=A0A232M1K5_9EURO|nr:hypothetical protein Egran_01998 [Elaphomyces granulatus]